MCGRQVHLLGQSKDHDYKATKFLVSRHQPRKATPVHLPFSFEDISDGRLEKGRGTQVLTDDPRVASHESC